MSKLSSASLVLSNAQAHSTQSGQALENILSCKDYENWVKNGHTQGEEEEEDDKGGLDLSAFSTQIPQVIICNLFAYLLILDIFQC